MPHWPFSRPDDLSNTFWINIHKGWWRFGVNWKIIHFTDTFIPAKCLFLYSSISSNHPGSKSVVRHGIKSFPSPQTAATTFAFSSVFCFFFYENGVRSNHNSWTTRMTNGLTPSHIPPPLPPPPPSSP